MDTTPVNREVEQGESPESLESPDYFPLKVTMWHSQGLLAWVPVTV